MASGSNGGRWQRRAGCPRRTGEEPMTPAPDDQFMCRALRLAALGRHASPTRWSAVCWSARAADRRRRLPSAGRGCPMPRSTPCGGGGEGARHDRLCLPGTLRPPRADPAVCGCPICGGCFPARRRHERPGPPRRRAGFERLRAAGVGVTVGVGEAQARALNAAFIKHRTTGLPWVVLKTAMTLDGKIATRTGDSRWITSPISRLAVHRQLRDRCDAIVTGVGTVLADDPALTTRLFHRDARSPLRVVVDSHCRTPVDAQIVQLAMRDGKTIIATTESANT